MVPTFTADVAVRPMLFWEHEGNRAVREGDWKLVCRFPGDWELYNLAADRSELHNLAAGQPRRVQELEAAWEAWAERCGVMSWGDLLQHRRRTK